MARYRGAIAPASASTWATVSGTMRLRATVGRLTRTTPHRAARQPRHLAVAGALLNARHRRLLRRRGRADRVRVLRRPGPSRGTNRGLRARPQAHPTAIEARQQRIAWPGCWQRCACPRRGGQPAAQRPPAAPRRARQIGIATRTYGAQPNTHPHPTGAGYVSWACATDGSRPAAGARKRGQGLNRRPAGDQVSSHSHSAHGPT